MWTLLCWSCCNYFWENIWVSAYWVGMGGPFRWRWGILRILWRSRFLGVHFLVVVPVVIGDITGAHLGS